MKTTRTLITRLLVATCLTALCGVGCSTSGGAGGRWTGGFVASEPAPFEDPIEARQGGFGCMALQYDLPAEGTSVEEEQGPPPIETRVGTQTASSKSSVAPPRPPRGKSNNGTDVAGK